jgi:type IV pilus assembly protein PilO
MAKQTSFIQAVWEQSRLKIVILILLVTAVVVSFVGQQLVVEPHLQALSAKQFKLQQYVRQRQVEFTNSGIPVSMAEQLEKNLDRFTALIPPKEQFSHFVGELFEWSNQTKLEITQVNYQPEIDDETGFLRYGLNFSVNGSYARIKKFIHLLENSERILMIDKISLSGGSRKKKGSEVSLNIALTTYFQGESS